MWRQVSKLADSTRQVWKLAATLAGGMMNTESFLTAIRDDPDDDNLRLVFADWLDDHDESERAALMRRQCAIERLRRLLPGRNSFFLDSIEADSQPPAHLVERWLGP